MIGLTRPLAAALLAGGAIAGYSAGFAVATSAHTAPADGVYSGSCWNALGYALCGFRRKGG